MNQDRNAHFSVGLLGSKLVKLQDGEQPTVARDELALVGSQVGHLKDGYGDGDEVAAVGEELVGLAGDGADVLGRGQDHDEGDVRADLNNFLGVYSAIPIRDD